MWVLIASALCGICGFNILKEKGHNPIIGIYLGCLLGIIGVIICYAFFDDKNKI